MIKRCSLFLFLAVLFNIACLSQVDSGEIRTLFKKTDSSKKVPIGWFVGPDGMYTQFKHRDVFLGGLNFGITINHFFSVGLAGNVILNSCNLWYEKIEEHQGAYLAGGYAGAFLEFTVAPKFPVHVSFPVLIGGGGLTYVYNFYSDWNQFWDLTSLDWDAFFVVEPGVRIELNVIKAFRIFVGGSYRYTPDLELMNTSPDLINNFNGIIGLKFGKF